MTIRGKQQNTIRTCMQKCREHKTNENNWRAGYFAETTERIGESLSVGEDKYSMAPSGKGSRRSEGRCSCSEPSIEEQNQCKVRAALGSTAAISNFLGKNSRNINPDEKYREFTADSIHPCVRVVSCSPSPISLNVRSPR